MFKYLSKVCCAGILSSWANGLQLTTLEDVPTALVTDVLGAEMTILQLEDGTGADGTILHDQEEADLITTMDITPK